MSKFSVWYVRSREEFAGCVEGGWACPVGWVRSSYGQEVAVYAGDSVSGIKAELRAEHKALKLPGDVDVLAKEG